MSKVVKPVAPVIVSHHSDTPATQRTYITGFALSLYLTITAYVLVVYHLFSRDAVLVSIFGLAILQFLVQLFFFLHLGRETKPRWKLAMFYAMIGVVFILVAGSIWIMTNLNYHMNSPQQLHNLHKEEGL